MDWNETRAIYLDQLGTAKVLLERVQGLCNKTPTEVSDDTLRVLQKLLPQVREQHNKLMANRFEVAVLGTEKAGKSSLLNAWLGEDILPNKDERCTYTSCEIWSASERDQRYQIEYYTPDEFDKQLTEKRQEAKQFTVGSSDRRKIEDDIQEIERLQEPINLFLRRGREERPFNDVCEVREELKQAIAENKAQARAVKRLQVWTMKLREGRDIVFHDVPGFDSPLQIHKAQAEEKVRQCDVILYAKPHDKPDLTDSEVRMLQMADEADKHVKVAQKIFIALTKIDSSKTPEQLQERIKISRSKWEMVPAERIVPVCPPAYLYRLGTGGPEVLKIGSELIHDLTRLESPDGIDKLKTTINHYIDTNRAHILEKRCRGLVEDTRQVITEVINSLKERYQDAPEDLQTALEDETFNQFTDWWAKEWKQIEEEFSTYYTSEIMPKEEVDALPQTNEKLKQFQASFHQLMDQLKTDLEYPAEFLERRYKTFGLAEEGVIQATKAHIRLRDELHTRAMSSLDMLSSDLANTLEAIISEVVDWIVKRLWEIEKIRTHLEYSGVQHERLEHGMSTLFLRFARPAVNLFLSTPRGERRQLIDTYRSEMIVLTEFYRGEDQSRKTHLDTFLNVGRWIKKTAGDRKARPSNYLDYFDDIDSEVITASNFEEIKAELRQDLEAFIDYLKHSVFFASGFLAYCRQELDRVKNRFLANEQEWRKLVASSFRRKHPSLMNVIPFNGEAELEFRQGIVVELKEIQKMFQEFQGLRN